MPHFVESGECSVHARQCGDEEEELSYQYEHCLVDDSLWRHPERRDADDGCDEGEPDGNDFLCVEMFHFLLELLYFLNLELFELLNL